MTTTLTAENIEQILKNDPGNPAFVRLANIYIDAGRLDDAVDACQTGLMAGPKPQVAVLAHIVAARALLKLARVDEAMAHLENSTDLLPGDPQAYRLAGALLHEVKMYREAMPFLSNALAYGGEDEATAKRIQECLDGMNAQKAHDSKPAQAAESQGVSAEPPAEASGAEAREQSVIPDVTDPGFSIDGLLEARPDAVPSHFQEASGPEGSDSGPAHESEAIPAPSEPPATPDPIGTVPDIADGAGIPNHGDALPGSPADGFRSSAKPEALSPFEQFDMMQGAGEFDGEDLPTMVDVAAYVPEGAAALAEASTDARSDAGEAPSTSGEAIEESDSSSGTAAHEQTGSQFQGAAEGQDVSAQPSEVLDGAGALGRILASEEGRSPESTVDSAEASTHPAFSAPVIGGAAAEPLPADALPAKAAKPASPFDQVQNSDDFSDFEANGVPTIVNVDAYVPADGGEKAGEGGVDASMETPFEKAAMADGPGFDEDQRDLSAIFRVLDGGADGEAEASPDAAAANGASPEGADIRPSAGAADEIPSPASGETSPAESAEGGSFLVSALLSSSNVKRRLSKEGIDASKGWFVPEELDGDKKPVPTAASPEGDATSAPFPAAVGGEPAGMTAQASPESCPAPLAFPAAEGIPAANAGDGVTALEVDEVENVQESQESGDGHGGGDSVPFPAERKPSIPPPLKPHLDQQQGKDSQNPHRAPPALPKTEAAASTGGLLSELPDEAIFSTPPKVASPSVVVTAQTADEIAKQYERELREKLLSQPPPSFWRKHWVKLAVATAAACLVAAGGLIYRDISAANQSDRIAERRLQRDRSLPLGTPQAYKDAIELSDRLLADVPQDSQAAATKAFAAAALYHRFGDMPDEMKATYRKMAEDGLETARTAAPGLALVMDYWLALDAGDKKKRDDAINALVKQDTSALATSIEKAEVHLFLAQRAIGRKRLEEASNHLNQAIAAEPSHVETFVASGNLFMREASSRDPFKAFNMFDHARKVSPNHVEALLGTVESALEQQVPAAESDEDLLEMVRKARASFDGANAAPPAWRPTLGTRLTLAEGRLDSRLGRHDAAISVLTDGLNSLDDAAEAAKAFRTPFQLALGSAYIAAGKYDEAAVLLKDVVQKSPRNIPAKILAAKSLLALGNLPEALKMAADVQGANAKLNQELTILRAIIQYENHQTERARALLRSTGAQGGESKDVLPVHAAIYLALIDAETNPEENLEQSLEVLKSVRHDGKWWALAQAIRGRLLLAKGGASVAEGIGVLSDAMAKDETDYESPCALGRFLAESGNFQKARESLETAFARNPFHDEAGLWLAETDLLLGDFEAAQQVLNGLIDRKGSVAAQEALVYLNLSKGELDAARFELTKLRKKYPRSQEASSASVIFFALNGEGDELRAEMKRISKHSSPSSRAHMAKRFFRMGKIQESKDLYAAMDKTSDGDDAKVGQLEIALASGDKKQRATAIKQLDALVKQATAKDSTMDRDCRARVLAADAEVQIASKKKGARKQAQAAVNAWPFSPEARLALAHADMKWGKADDVIQSLEMAIRLEPAMARAYADLGLFLERTQGNPERAAYCLNMALKLTPDSPDKALMQKALARLAFH